MDKVALSFSTNAKLEKLIGRELITNNIIAIFELIKNSYDAFAHNAIVSFEGFDISSKDLGKVRHSEHVISNVDSRIIIKDDGVGMSFEEVKTKWMEIGTTSKENTYIEKSLYSSEDKRVINGEKGIGRFGADKLGSLLRLISVGADGYEKTTLEIDWNKFDDHEKKIQDIDFDCYVERCTTPQKTGLTLEISLLRDKWTIADIVKLKNHLKKLISPFAQEQERFQIYLEYSKNDIERIVNDSFEYATTGIIANIDQYGLVKYEIYTALESECKEIKLVPPGFGPLKLQILYMDKAAKNAFTRRTGTTTKDYGNIKVFRDDFRVLPYGEKENGAVFSHMAVMYANALYSQGFVKEGYKVLNTLLHAAMNFESSYMYPGLPEYFDSDGRGLYAYLTGAASWYMLTMITEAFGVRGEIGNLVIAPALMAEQFDKEGNAVMVDVSGKNVTYRTALATGYIAVGPEIMACVTEGNVKKGDVLGVARVAGIMGVKKTSELIPMCHPLPIQKCAIDYELDQEKNRIHVLCTVKTEGKTGVEMEALTGVQVTLLTIYDMCKAIDKHMVMSEIHLIEKTGGKSGDFRFEEEQ